MTSTPRRHRSNYRDIRADSASLPACPVRPASKPVECYTCQIRKATVTKEDGLPRPHCHIARYGKTRLVTRYTLFAPGPRNSISVLFDGEPSVSTHGLLAVKDENEISKFQRVFMIEIVKNTQKECSFPLLVVVILGTDELRKKSLYQQESIP